MKNKSAMIKFIKEKDTNYICFVFFLFLCFVALKFTRKHANIVIAMSMANIIVEN